MNLTRRQALQIGAAALASTSLAGCKSLGLGGNTPTGDIDAHAHVWSDDLERYPLGPWATRAEMKPATFTADELLAIMNRNGVGRAVLIQHAPLHGYDNAYILDCARRYPGVFSVVAMINERTANLCERLRDLRDQGARGIRIGPTKHADRTLNVDPPNWLNAPGQQALWKHASELGVAVCPLLSGEFLPTLIPMCERYPDTTVVIDHFGHFNPGVPADIQALSDLSGFANVYLKVSAFYKFGRPPYSQANGDLVKMIRIALDMFGAERLMWASDCPYQLNGGNNYADAIGLIREGMPGLSDTERRAILRGTAAEVFF
ncbi:MAG: amidohydrolase family protein [Phycisphaeraceae bacterium]